LALRSHSGRRIQKSIPKNIDVGSKVEEIRPWRVLDESWNDRCQGGHSSDPSVTYP
jgi:hypothetical protein